MLGNMCLSAANHAAGGIRLVLTRSISLFLRAFLSLREKVEARRNCAK
jgi:hypothetical protein